MVGIGKKMTFGVAVLAVAAFGFRPAWAQQFSLFDYDQTFSISGSWSYFHYNEATDLNTLIDGFVSEFHREPLLNGAPKSSEYGSLWGLSTAGTFYSRITQLFFKPKIAGFAGMGMQYDGTTQEQFMVDEAGNKIGLEFDGVLFPKNNFFLTVGSDFGFAVAHCRFPFAIYSGFEYGVWWRSLLDNGTNYAPTVANHETYSWWDIPLGVIITDPVSPTLLFGLDVRAGLRTAGYMQNTFNSGAGDSVYYYPQVTLDNQASLDQKTSLRVALFMETKYDEHSAVKFAPYFELYHFGQSDWATGTATATSGGPPSPKSFYEPNSTTYMIGLDISVEFLSKRGFF
jgi:hypothetical protein